MTLPPLSRLLVLAAAVLLAALYAVPLWHIALGAPQYPEGLGLEIWIDRIVGVKEHDLRNINALNHYIGMRAIEPDSIAELRFMPWILGATIAFGVVVAAVGRLRLLVAWLTTLVVLGIAGLADFWRWGYDYGHNLDHEMAIIKVPGMTYQPPILGTKQLLNFTATSMPSVGGWLAFAAFALGAVALWLALRGRRPSASSRSAGSLRPIAALLLVSVGLAGCQTAHPEIRYDEDSCRYCRMVVSDRRFAAVLTTERGREFIFDSVECMANFHLMMPESPGSLLVSDYARPGTLLPVEDALIARVDGVDSPMGLALAAFGRRADLTALAGADAHPLAWSEVLTLVRDAQAARAAGSAGHVH